MNIRTFASGSRGNAALVWQGGTYILVDAGISLRRLEKSLAELSVSVCQLSAILLTHEHTDHISGLPTLVKRYPQIPIVTSGGTARSVALRNRVTEVTQLEVGRTFEIGELEVTSFETPHDVAESVGFTFFDGKRKLGYATDLGHVSPIVKRALLGADTVLLESNHDRDMLWYGAYPYKLKQRIAGLYGHLSNEDSGEFA
ncbi:MAG: MBL fold metallo-hydrolase, partial [Oscillospiraceae bacterium]|nr:MBL fold metallo-hydrolase [Oscillospiraceae bacterium]